MKILLCFDEGYAPHAATLMEELLDHSSVPLSFTVLYVSLSEQVISQLTNHFSTRVESLKFHRVDPELTARVSGKKGGWHLPIESYLRLFASLFIDDKWVIYMDIDIICRGDIARIMDEVTEPYPIYAVKEYDEQYKMLDKRYYESLKTRWGSWNTIEPFFQGIFHHLEMSHPVRYFGAGVMVLNLDEWRKENLTSKVMDYIAATKFLYYHDQDALNHVIDGRFGILHPRWNNAGAIAYGSMTGYSPEQIAEARQHPVLHHFVGFKQWTWVAWVKGKAGIYWKYRRRTPWPASRPNEPLRKVVGDLYWEYCKRFWKRSR